MNRFASVVSRRRGRRPDIWIVLQLPPSQPATIQILIDQSFPKKDGYLWLAMFQGGSRRVYLQGMRWMSLLWFVICHLTNIYFFWSWPCCHAVKAILRFPKVMDIIHRCDLTIRDFSSFSNDDWDFQMIFTTIPPSPVLILIYQLCNQAPYDLEQKVDSKLLGRIILHVFQRYRPVRAVSDQLWTGIFRACPRNWIILKA